MAVNFLRSARIGSVAAAIFAIVSPALAGPYDCKTFGKVSFGVCSGSCPSGWKQAHRSPCPLGSKAYCCPIGSSKKEEDDYWAKRKLEYACQKYAGNAVIALKTAREKFKCSAAVLSGARWTSTYSQHQAWCRGASENARNTEQAERERIMRTCNAKSPPGPKPPPVAAPALNVRLVDNKTFFIVGSGFVPGTPVVLIVSGSAAKAGRYGTANGQRIVASSTGAIAVREGAATLCRTAGPIFFRAEDQDGVKKTQRTARARCP
jgi:hypothetical protein